MKIIDKNLSNVARKLFFAIIISVVAIFSNPIESNAQGVYTCHWDGSSCTVINNCTSPYVPDTLRCTLTKSSAICVFRTKDEPCISAGATSTTGAPGVSVPVDLTALEAVTPGFEFKSQGIGDVINKLVTKYLFVIVGGLLLLYLISGSLQLMTSGGDPKAAQAAKTKVTNALIGFVLVFSAYWVTTLLGNILGLNGFGGIF